MKTRFEGTREDLEFMSRHAAGNAQRTTSDSDEVEDAPETGSEEPNASRDDVTVNALMDRILFPC